MPINIKPEELLVVSPSDTTLFVYNHDEGNYDGKSPFVSDQKVEYFEVTVELLSELFSKEKLKPIIQYDPSSSGDDKNTYFSKGKTRSDRFNKLGRINLPNGFYFLNGIDGNRLLNHIPEELRIYSIHDDDFHYFPEGIILFSGSCILITRDSYSSITNGKLVLEISTPKNLDDWGKCLRDLYINYYKLNNRKPNSAQFWSFLFNYNNQNKWGINSITKNNLSPYLSLGGVDLDRKAFEKRFKNYFSG